MKMTIIDGHTGLKNPFFWIQRMMKRGYLLKRVGIKFHTNLISSHML